MTLENFNKIGIRVISASKKIDPRGSASTSGVTLIELVVAAALFSLLVAAMAGIFLSAIRSEQFAVSFISAQNNVRFALEVMAREARTGNTFRLCPLPASCSADDDVSDNMIFRFINQADQDVCYRRSGGRLERGVNCSSFSPITGNRVTIQRLRFYMRGARPDDGLQPQITIMLQVLSGGESANVQTTVTQREIDS